MAPRSYGRRMDSALAWTIIGSAAAVVAIPTAVAIGVLQLRQGRRAAGRAGDGLRLAIPPLPPLVPGTALIGYVPALPPRFVVRQALEPAHMSLWISQHDRS